MSLLDDKALRRIAEEASAKNPRIYELGILGGTFDPPHEGHVAAARASRDQLGLDAVLFVPACVPVYKLDQYVTPASDRLAMTQCAIEGEEGFLVSDIEIARGGKTYTADTLRQLRDALPPNVRVTFIAGVDAALTIPKWKESGVIQELARIAMVARPGYRFSQEDERYAVLTDRFSVSYVDATTPDAASSRIRELLDQGQPIDHLVPRKVAEYANQHGLYQKRDDMPAGDME